MDAHPTTPTIYSVEHVLGYDVEQEPVTEIRDVTYAKLADWLGSDDLARHLIATGRLGEHDEWAVLA